MSVNMDTVDMTDQEVDYSDFSHEVVNISQQLVGQNSTDQRLFRNEPLAQQGGLRPNQVAELVSVYIVVSNALEDGETGQNGSKLEYRGTLGVDLSPEDNDDVTTNPTDANNVEGEVIDIQDSGTGGIIATGSATRPEVITFVRCTGPNHFQKQIDFRSDEYTGRGPVFDSDDSLDFIGNAINSGNDSDHNVTMKLVWDIYEVDNARSEFALPMSD